MKFLDNEQREQIGFSFVINEVAVITAYGNEEKKKIKPFKVSEREKLINEFNNIEAIIKAMEENSEEFNYIVRVLHRIKDVRNTIKRLKSSVVLDEIELYEIKNIAINVQDLKEAIERINLNISKIHLSSLKEIIALLDPENKKLSTFYIYDNYSERLKKIRKEKSKLEKAIFSSENELEIEKLKKQRLDIVIEEEAEELEIRKELSRKIAIFADNIEENLWSIGYFDLLMAKGNLAEKYQCKKPIITNNMHIELVNVINPEIDAILKKGGKHFSPVSIELNSGTTVITGANMGGKSVALKTIVLNLFLGQLGFFVFGEFAAFPILDFLHFISDDMQSVSKGLSTFGAEIIKLKEVVECTKRGNGFIALDEFARGTNPKEGYYLVKSLANYLQDFKTISLISTHYDGVVDDSMIHYQVAGLKNMNLDQLRYKIDLNKTHSVEIIQEHMEYKLERVSNKNQVPKDALNIAMLLGLDEKIINIAKTYYEEEYHGK